jgi:hypothetical protein
MRKTLGIAALLAFVLVSVVSAYSYNDQYTFSYSESNNGFAIGQTNSNKQTSSNYCDSGAYYDWSSDGRYCRQTEYYNGRRVDRYYTLEDDTYAEKPAYDQDKAIAQAFKTYQQTSKQKYQLASQHLNLQYQRKYNYGYARSSSSWSGRVYRWGW